MSFLPLSKIRTNFSEFRGVFNGLEEALRKRSEKIWKGFTFGGLNPGLNQYDLVNILPRNMNIPRGFGSWSYLQKFSAPGSWTNIFSYTVPKNQIHSFAGFRFQGPNMIFSALRLQISNVIYPIISLDETRMFAKEGISLILKTDKGKEIIVQEKVSMTLKGWQERNTCGFNMRIVPIGLMSYKVKNDLIKLSATST